MVDAYSSKSWATLVAPTNRRPYGFDWEDWGRLDAMEVLRHAEQDLHTDTRRVYLTGHSSVVGLRSRQTIGTSAGFQMGA